MGVFWEVTKSLLSLVTRTFCGVPAGLMSFVFVARGTAPFTGLALAVGSAGKPVTSGVSGGTCVVVPGSTT